MLGEGETSARRQVHVGVYTFLRGARLYARVAALKKCNDGAGRGGAGRGGAGRMLNEGGFHI